MSALPFPTLREFDNTLAIARSQYDTGYHAGYAVATREALARSGLALGIGVVIGTGFGVVLTFLLAGWLA